MSNVQRAEAIIAEIDSAAYISNGSLYADGEQGLRIIKDALLMYVAERCQE